MRWGTDERLDLISRHHKVRLEAGCPRDESYFAFSKVVHRKLPLKQSHRLLW